MVATRMSWSDVETQAGSRQIKSAFKAGPRAGWKSSLGGGRGGREGGRGEFQEDRGAERRPRRQARGGRRLEGKPRSRPRDPARPADQTLTLAGPARPPALRRPQARLPGAKEGEFGPRRRRAPEPQRQPRTHRAARAHRPEGGGRVRPPRRPAKSRAPRVHCAAPRRAATRSVAPLTSRRAGWIGTRRAGVLPPSRPRPRESRRQARRPERWCRRWGACLARADPRRTAIRFPQRHVWSTPSRGNFGAQSQEQHLRVNGCGPKAKK